MSCKGCQRRDEQIHNLKKQITILKQSNHNTSRKLKELLQHSTMQAGIKGEKLIMDVVKGSLSKRGAPYDIRLQNGKKVEVKHSRVTTPVRGSTCHRWVWNGVIGERDLKDYDALVLIGDKDGEYHTFEEDQSSFVFFILTKSNIRKMIVPSGKRGWVSLNINPDTTRSPYSRLLWKYKVSAVNVKKFFARLQVHKA